MKTNPNIHLSVQWGGDQALMLIEISDSAVADWSLLLCLLREGLIADITVTSSKGSPMLTIKHSPKLPANRRGKVSWSGEDVQLNVSTMELEYWLYFFLKYYRDGIADVDHIDVDLAKGQSDSSRGLFLILRVPNAVPPVSQEEAKRRLGLE